MIIILRPHAAPKQEQSLCEYIESCGLKAVSVPGDGRSVLCVVGDASALAADYIRSLDFVESVKAVTAPYRLAGRLSHPDDSVISVGSVSIGGGGFAVIAGPCSVESREQVCGIASAVKASGATLLRGGAFKPRTSPYDFQGLRSDGIPLLLEAKRLTGLPVVSEILDMSQLPLFEDIDVIQVGARNMQNTELLKALSRCGKPILLKRGWSNTVDELLTSAEYLMSGGNADVILCERGIRTFETATRNTLDLSAVPVIKERSHLPVIVDPSHATGKSAYVEPMALAAPAAGADGVMIEVHNDPAHARCDGPQALTPQRFDALCKKLFAVRKAVMSCEN